ncbi:MAG: iron-containing redox enzyme family protein [Acidobacteriota bacterium]|nr:iron-containing redox enzyme family protein [Acidobacteriota bacterium]
MNLNDLIEQVLKETDYYKNPYFVNLREKTFEKYDFVETQIQFFYAVIFFSRPMAALAAKIPTPELRLEVLRNIWEEHGEGSLSQAHGATFLEFLRRIGNVTKDEVYLRGLWADVRIFNTTLSGVSVLDDFIIAVGALGIIERMFSDISAWIGQGVIKNGWLAADEMIHYTLHRELDIKHSEDFFKILDMPFKNSAENRYLIEQGLRLGATLFNNLYLGLWNRRKTRWILEQPFVTSQAADYIP